MNATASPCQADVGEPEKDGPKLWCSSIDSEDEEVYGPFDTREEAIEAARARRDAFKFDDTECTVGHCEYADPGCHLTDSQIELMIESLDEFAHEDMFCWVDDDVFDWRTSDSEESFAHELRDLLRKHVKSKYFLMAMDGREKVTLPPNVDDPQRKLCERMSDKSGKGGLTSDQIERINAILETENYELRARVAELQEERTKIVDAVGMVHDDDPDAPKALVEYVRETQLLAVRCASEWASDHAEASVRKLSRGNITMLDEVHRLRRRVEELEAEASNQKGGE